MNALSAKRLACALLFAMLLSACLCRAAPILDQSFTQPGGAAVFINEATAFIAQTYTAQRTGTLAAISVDVESVAGARLRISIRTAVNGLPTAEVLGETLLDGSSAAVDELITFRERIVQRRGVQYAIAVDYPEEPPPAGLTHRWNGAPGDLYVPGGIASSLDGINWSFEAPGSIDVHFRSFVDVSTPGILGLFLVGLSSFLTTVYRRRSR